MLEKLVSQIHTNIACGRLKPTAEGIKVVWLLKAS